MSPQSTQKILVTKESFLEKERTSSTCWDISLNNLFQLRFYHVHSKHQSCQSFCVGWNSTKAVNHDARFFFWAAFWPNSRHARAQTIRIRSLSSWPLFHHPPPYMIQTRELVRIAKNYLIIISKVLILALSIFITLFLIFPASAKTNEYLVVDLYIFSYLITLSCLIFYCNLLYGIF